MSKHILITGGAGFIGSHLADQLLAAGHRVRAYDNLSPQVHGPDARRPDYLHDDVELVVGDIRDRERLRKALDGVDAVYHLAAMVGVGQSMYEVARYTDVNNLGTATLLDLIAQKLVERLIVASSMSVYGEGLYQRGDGGAIASDVERDLALLKRGLWEPLDAAGTPLTAIATPETKPPCLSSVYALSKYDTERMSLIIGRAYGVPTVALRFFNVYGPRQALSNPYTGVLAIFASRLLNGRPPLINEDGLQRRDFVSVHDVAHAARLALTSDAAAGLAINVGSGVARSVKEVADAVAKAVGRRSITAEITGRYRVGDIRHCFPDVTLARRVLGYSPRTSFEDGLAELAGWLENQVAVDRVEAARAELQARGLAI